MRKIRFFSHKGSWYILSAHPEGTTGEQPEGRDGKVDGWAGLSFRMQLILPSKCNIPAPEDCWKAKDLLHYGEEEPG